MVMPKARSRILEGSCWPCRKRRIKCDLEKPTCGRCLERQQSCSYSTNPPVKWVGGAATRGRLATSSQSPQSPKSPKASPASSSSSSSSSTSSISSTSTSSTATTMLVASPSTHPMETGDVILYFANAVLPRFQIPDEAIPLDLDHVLHDEPLQQVIIAISQAHYALHSKVEVYDTTLLRQKARQTALEGFSSCLRQGVRSESSAQRLFVMNVLLCILDGMIQPSGDHNASTCHLRGGFAILDKWTNTPTRMLLHDGLQAHLLSVYATIDLAHAMLSGDRPFFSPMIWKMFAGVQTWFGRLRKGDRFLEILAAYSDMATLGNVVFSNQHVKSVDLVEKCLGPIEASFTSRSSSSSSSGGCQNNGTPAAFQGIDVSSSAWMSFCSIYEICGIIYLQRALRLRPMNDDVVQAATRRGVDKLIDPALPPMMRHCVIFPMLVIGSHCTLARDRRAILEALSPSASYLSFGNMQLMTGFLRATWDRGQAHESWWECFASVAQKAFLF